MQFDYQRAVQEALTEPGKDASRTLAEMKRFFAKTEPLATGCAIWTGYRIPLGYGAFWSGGKRCLAHRKSWEWANRSVVPSGMVVCHRCDNPPCIRPDHLFLGTMADNTADMIRKGRNRVGERASWSKLTEQDVRQIFDLARAGERLFRIARRFRVNPTAIIGILNGRNWAHLNIPPIMTSGAGTRHRGLTGQENHQAKLSDIDVKEIKAALARGELAVRIAEAYGVHKTLISQIKHDSHIPGRGEETVDV